MTQAYDIHNMAPSPDFPEARCRDTDPEWWFPNDGDTADTIEGLRSICRTCPHINECGDYALNELREGRYLWGVWGGLTQQQRAHLLTKEAS